MLAVLMGTFTVDDSGTMNSGIIDQLRDGFCFVRNNKKSLFLILFVKQMQYLCGCILENHGIKGFIPTEK